MLRPLLTGLVLLTTLSACANRPATPSAIDPGSAAHSGSASVAAAGQDQTTGNDRMTQAQQAVTEETSTPARTPTDGSSDQPTANQVSIAAAETGEQGLSGAATAKGDTASQGRLERSRDAIRGATEWVARGVDSWFGDKPFEDGGKVTHGRIGLKTLWRQDRALRVNLRFRARFDLPNLRERAYLFVGQDNEEELVSDQPEAFSRQQQLLSENRRDDMTLFAGLGVAIRDNIDLRAGIRGGYKVYAQARYQNAWVFGERNRIDFRETLFWRVKDGFGSTTTLDYEYAYSPSLALRWQNTGTVSESTDGLAWSSSVGAFRAFGDLRLLSLEALVGGSTGARHNIGEYGVRVRWEQPVYQDWILGEIIVGHFWPRRDGDSERQRSWAVGGGIEMRF